MSRDKLEDYVLRCPSGCGHVNRWHGACEYKPLLVVYLAEKDGERCGVCNKYINAMEEVSIDHIRPVSLGGKNRINNFRLAHRRCNRFRGKRMSRSGKISAVLTKYAEKVRNDLSYEDFLIDILTDLQHLATDDELTLAGLQHWAYTNGGRHE